MEFELPVDSLGICGFRPDGSETVAYLEASRISQQSPSISL